MRYIICLLLFTTSCHAGSIYKVDAPASQLKQVVTNTVEHVYTLDKYDGDKAKCFKLYRNGRDVGYVCFR